MNDLRPAAKATREKVETDQAAFPEFDSLARALQKTPAVRQSELLRAKELVGDQNYPPVEVVRRLAKLFSIHFNNE
jgi:hypothetical protein